MDTENGISQEARGFLVSKSIEFKEIKGTYLSYDSSNAPVEVKETTPRTSNKDRFDKTNKPKGDLEYRLNIVIYFPKPF